MEDLSNRTMQLERTFDAPVELVWTAFSTPEFFVQWWGPEGFTNTISNLEFKQGGIWEFTMHGPDGTDYPNKYECTTLVPFEKIVLKHLLAPLIEITAEMEPRGAQTLVRWTVVFDSIPTMEEAVRANNADSGLIENMARFQRFVQDTASWQQTQYYANGSELLVVRAFNATNTLVWRAWTEPELLDQWWAPKPWKSKTASMSFEVGGKRLYVMEGPEGEAHWGLTEYTNINPISSFEGTDYFCDSEGNVNPELPGASFINQFTDQGNRTIVVIHSKYASPAHLQQVVQMGFKQGLAMAFENLDQVLQPIQTA